MTSEKAVAEACSGFLIVDKPEGLTSHQVIGRLRRLLKIRRIGHTGTLDPMATGVLPILIGRATRASDFIMEGQKTYEAKLRLGITTDTQDSTGQTLTEWPGELPSFSELRAVLPRFSGEVEQVPPMVSALKVGGRKLYELHRQGVEVERSPRRVLVSALDAAEDADGQYKLRVVCSKGTYVRTLIHDIGQALGCGAMMTALRRTQAAPFSIEDAVTLDEVAHAVDEGRFMTMLRPIDEAFSQYPELMVDEAGERSIRHSGRSPLERVTAGRPPESGQSVSKTYFRVYGPSGFLMLGSVPEEGEMILGKTFFEVSE